MMTAFTIAFTIACVLTMIAGFGFLMAPRNAGMADHTAEPQYPCTPVCAPVTKEMERAFGKSDEELIQDMLDYKPVNRP